MEAKKTLASVLRQEAHDTQRERGRFVNRDETHTNAPGLGQESDIDRLQEVYLWTVNNQLYRRYPSIDDLNSISGDEIRRVALFCMGVSPILQEVWLENIERVSNEYFPFYRRKA